MFNVDSIVAQTHDSSFGGYKWKVEVRVSMPVKEWSKARATGSLGQLYGIDIGNHVYHIDQNIPAHNPMVDDKARASKGIKRIRLTYFLNDADRAEALGLKVMRFKNGEVCGGFNDYIKLI